MSKRTMVIEGNTIRYLLDGKDVSEATYHAAEWKTRPPNYEKGECPGMHPDYGDFREEKDRKSGYSGRYFPQLAKFPGDKRAIMPHKNDAIRIAKKRGWTIDEE